MISEQDRDARVEIASTNAKDMLEEPFTWFNGVTVDLQNEKLRAALREGFGLTLEMRHPTDGKIVVHGSAGAIYVSYVEPDWSEVTD